MSRFVLDTGVLLTYIRGHEIYNTIEQENNLLEDENIILISIVSKAEILTLGGRKNWGKNKMDKLRTLLNKLVIIGIDQNDEELINAYVTIDSFSQGHLQDMPLNMAARNMGKNDIWIAATTLVTNSTLITLDSDFDHLTPTIIRVLKYAPP